MVPFTLTKEQFDIQRALREFTKAKFRPVARELDSKEIFDERLWKKAFDLEFLAVFVDERYGGLGAGYPKQCVIAEEDARVNPGITHSIGSAFLGTQLIQLPATEKQKEKYLASVCRGGMRMGVAITEPDAGSDVTSVTTEAVKEIGKYVINGDKILSPMRRARIS